MMFRSVTQLAGAIWRNNFQRLKRPYKLLLSITDRCNLRCQACGIWKLPQREELDARQYDRFFRANPHLSWIDFAGGEIFLHPELPAIVEALIRRCPRLFLFHFPTNGWLTGTILESTERFRSLGVKKMIVSVSLDGPEAVHDRLRGREGSWRRALETFNGLRRIPGVETYLGMTLTHFNQHLFQETYRAAASRVAGLTPLDIHLNVAHRSFYYNNPVMPLPSRTAISHTVASAISARSLPRSVVSLMEREYLRRVDRYLAHGRSPIPCQALTGSCYVDAVGLVYPCIMWDRPLGHIDDTSSNLEELWRRPLRSRLRRLVDRGLCPGCWTPCEAYQSIYAHFLHCLR